MGEEEKMFEIVFFKYSNFAIKQDSSFLLMPGIPKRVHLKATGQYEQTLKCSLPFTVVRLSQGNIQTGLIALCMKVFTPELAGIETSYKKLGK